MALTINVDGPALVKCGTGVSGALETLGYTMDGVRITEEVFSGDVPGDENGGTSGPPIDVQYFGEMHIVQLELSKWELTVEANLSARLRNGTQGTPGTPGTLWSADSKTYRLLIQPTSRPRNYLGAIPRGSFEINKGTKFSRRVMVFHCYSVAGVLFNTVTS